MTERLGGLRLILLCGVLFNVSGVLPASEMPDIEESANLQPEWEVVEEGEATFGTLVYSWSVFREPEKGDRISIQIVQSPGKESGEAYYGGPWTEAGISTFSLGYKDKENRPKDDPVKVISYATAEMVKLGGRPSVLFTTYYEMESGRHEMAHGYHFAYKDLRILVQHTSKEIIVIEDVDEIATNILSHLERRDLRTNPSSSR